MIAKLRRCGRLLSLRPHVASHRGTVLLQANHHGYRPITSTAQDPSSSWLSPANITRPDQVFVSTTTDPFENLAIEHHLLNHGPVDSGVLFLYTNRPSVVIGRNQNPWIECDLRAISRGLPISERGGNSSGKALQHEEVCLVRRRSGGGTVFHDLGNLNYSIIVPNDKSFTRRKCPGMIVEALQKKLAHLTGDKRRDISVNDRNDIVLKAPGSGNPLKISGSAYKLTRGKALTHGTLLFACPNLHRISGLLRSPGKIYLKAKGVESVRSPVGNLYSGDLTEHERLSIRNDLYQTIISHWNGTTQYPRRTVEVGSWDCQRVVNKDVAAGIDELKNDAYRFEQTPGFEVDTGLVNGQGLKFVVKNGTIENLTLVGPHLESDSGSQWFQRLMGRKVHELNIRTELAKPLAAFPALLERLDLIFPAITTGVSATSSHMGSDMTEVEIHGTNTVTDVPIDHHGRPAQ